MREEEEGQYEDDGGREDEVAHLGLVCGGGEYKVFTRTSKRCEF